MIRPGAASLRKSFAALAYGRDFGPQLVRGGTGSLLVIGGSTTLRLLLTVVLARVLGAAEYGIYAYVFALISVLAIPSQFGLPQLVVRETAKSRTQQQWGLMRGVWRWASSVTLVLSLAVALGMGIIAWWLAGHFSVSTLATFMVALFLVPVMALAKLRDAALRGLHRVVQGQLSDTILRPAFFLSLIAIFLLMDTDLSALTAMTLHTVAACLAFFIGSLLLYRARPPQLVTKPAPVYQSQQWLRSVIPLAFTSGMQLVNKHTDLLVLGLFASAAEVGIYRVVAQGSALVLFGLTAINMLVAPHFARLYVEQDFRRLQKLTTISARLALVIALPLVVIFIVYGNVILSAAFGDDFGRGHIALAILGVGYLVAALFGSVANLLNMTGHERDSARGLGIAAALNVVLNFVLVPIFGIEGAAVATALTVTLSNFLLWRAVARRLGIDSTAFGLFIFQEHRSP